MIVQVADVIKNCSEDGDIPTRWGGEEIAIYLPHVDLKEGVKLARKIKKRVAEQTSPRVTLSSGVATWNKHNHDTVTELFIRADEALYKAKTQGKNRVVTEKPISS